MNKETISQNKEEPISQNKDEQIARYIGQLNEQQLKAFILAKNHLGSSFNICKSNGFIDWKNAKK